MPIRTLIVVDVSNLYYCLHKHFGGRKLNYRKFLDLAQRDSSRVRAVAYGTDSDRQADQFKATLRRLGFETKFKKPKIFRSGGRKADWDVGITVDVIRWSRSYDRVIFGTADSDFAPCIRYVRNLGKEVIVIGSKISYELKRVATKCIEINKDMLE